MKLNLKTTGLVLEGGGMRGVFTSGVLDAFMKHDVHFPYTVAVSAGSEVGESRRAPAESFLSAGARFRFLPSLPPVSRKQPTSV